MSTINKLKENRLQKLEKIKKAGIDPYPAVSERTHLIEEVLKSFEILLKNP